MSTKSPLSLDNYIPSQQEVLSPSNSLIKIINEKNILIEKYRACIDEQEKKHQSEIDKLTNDLSNSSQEIISLKSKLSSLEKSDIVELVNYYEKEISKITSESEKNIQQYKSKISLLSTGGQTSNKQIEKLKKVIETLMKENDELKEKNDSLWKINRMNEAYKSLAKQYGNKVIENNKNIQNFQKEQISQLNALQIENKRLKDEKEEDKKLINNLANTIEYLKTKYQDTNTNINTVNNVNIKKQNKPSNNNTIHNTLLKKANSSLSLVSSSSLSSKTKQMMLNYADNQAMIELDNLKLDKYLNSCRMIISEKISNITNLLSIILEKINKENSIYKKIILKNIKEIEDNLQVLNQENVTLIKKSNSAFNYSKLSKNLLRDIVNESNNKSKTSKKENLICIDEVLIDLVKKFLNTFN